MSDIYIPGSRANEYCRYALNLYLGCNHGCLYCYAPSTMKKKRGQYSEIKPTSNTIENKRKFKESMTLIYRIKEDGGSANL